MSYLVYLLNDQAPGQPKILDSFNDTARLLKEQFQLEACNDAEGNFICFAPPTNADRLPENEPDEDTAIFYSHNEQEGGILWLKSPNESQLELLQNIMLALNDGSYMLGDAGERYCVKKARGFIPNRLQQNHLLAGGVKPSNFGILGASR